MYFLCTTYFKYYHIHTQFFYSFLRLQLLLRNTLSASHNSNERELHYHPGRVLFEDHNFCRNFYKYASSYFQTFVYYDSTAPLLDFVRMKLAS